MKTATFSLVFIVRRVEIKIFVSFRSCVDSSLEKKS